MNYLEYYRVHYDDSLNSKWFFSYVILKMNREPLLWCILLVCETDIVLWDIYCVLGASDSILSLCLCVLWFLLCFFCLAVFCVDCWYLLHFCFVLLFYLYIYIFFVCFVILGIFILCLMLLFFVLFCFVLFCFVVLCFCFVWSPKMQFLVGLTMCTNPGIFLLHFRAVGLWFSWNLVLLTSQQWD